MYEYPYTTHIHVVHLSRSPSRSIDHARLAFSFPPHLYLAISIYLSIDRPLSIFVIPRPCTSYHIHVIHIRYIYIHICKTYIQSFALIERKGAAAKADQKNPRLKSLLDDTANSFQTRLHAHTAHRTEPAEKFMRGAYTHVMSI